MNIDGWCGMISYIRLGVNMAKIIKFENNKQNIKEKKSKRGRKIIKRFSFVISIIATFCTITGITITTLIEKDWQETAEHYNNDGLELYDLGKYKEAIELYDKAIDLENKGISDIDVCYYNRGRAYFKLENFDKAIGDYSQAICISSKSKYYSDRAVAYEKNGEFDKAAIDNILAVTNITN